MTRRRRPHVLRRHVDRVVVVNYEPDPEAQDEVISVLFDLLDPIVQAKRK